MDRFDTQSLRQLIEIKDDNCISMYMPTQRKTTDFKKDPIRLKNVIAEAERRVASAGKDKSFGSQLEKLRLLVDDPGFWKYQEDGLALFLSAEAAFIYRLPVHFDEWVILSHRFHLKPLFPMFGVGGNFYVLALSQNSVRVLRCTRYSVDRLDIGKVADGIEAGLGHYDTKISQLQFHTGTGDGDGNRPAMFHGHGVGIDDTKDEILRYFRIIDQKLGEILTSKEAPVVMAGVDYLLPIFRSTGSNLHLLEEGISGNPEEATDRELHQKAWPVVEPFFRRDLQDALKRFAELNGTGLASGDFDTVLRACCNGRTETLFFGKGIHKFGTYDLHKQRIDVHEAEMSGDEELIDLAAVETFKNGGRVYAVNADEVPGGGVLAAVLRY
jgi:hypothetical protein